jgi:glucan biosynthesis protein C
MADAPPAGQASPLVTLSHGPADDDFPRAGVLYALIRRSLFLLYPPLLSNGLFNFVVMQTLFYLPFFVLGAQTFINPRLKTMFTTRRRGAARRRCWDLSPIG